LSQRTDVLFEIGIIKIEKYNYGNMF